MATMYKQYCVNCGKELFDYDKFCPACGTPVQRPQETNNLPMSGAQPAQAQVPTAAPWQIAAAPQSKPRSFRCLICVVAGIIALACIIVSVLVVKRVVGKLFSDDRRSTDSVSTSARSRKNNFFDDLKDLHDATQELKQDWHDNVEVPFRQLDKELKESAKDIDYTIKAAQEAEAGNFSSARQWLYRMKDDKLRQELLSDLEKQERNLRSLQSDSQW